jgi:hypothetical protein
MNLNLSSITQCIQRCNQQAHKASARLGIEDDFTVALKHKIYSSLEKNFIWRIMVRKKLLDCIVEKFMGMVKLKAFISGII